MHEIAILMLEIEDDGCHCAHDRYPFYTHILDLNPFGYVDIQNEDYMHSRKRRNGIASNHVQISCRQSHVLSMLTTRRYLVRVKNQNTS